LGGVPVGNRAPRADTVGDKAFDFNFYCQFERELKPGQGAGWKPSTNGEGCRGQGF